MSNDSEDKPNHRDQQDGNRPLGEQGDFRGNSDADNREPAPEDTPPPEADRRQQWPQQERPNEPMQDQPLEQQQRAGTGMYWAAALIALALLTLFFNNLLERKQQTDGITEKLLQQADGHYYARGAINGQRALFIVDTGASVVSIPEKLAEQMNLRKLTASEASTANGVVTVYDTSPITVQLGDIKLYDVEAHINPGMEPPAILLGMSFLRRLDFRQRDNRLILKTRPD